MIAWWAQKSVIFVRKGPNRPLYNLEYRIHLSLNCHSVTSLARKINLRMAKIIGQDNIKGNVIHFCKNEESKKRIGRIRRSKNSETENMKISSTNGLVYKRNRNVVFIKNEKFWVKIANMVDIFKILFFCKKRKFLREKNRFGHNYFAKTVVEKSDFGQKYRLSLMA